MAAYQPMTNPVADYTDIWGMLGKARQASRAEETRRAELLMRQQGVEREDARLSEQMRQAGAREQRQQGLDVAAAIPKVKAMLTPGHPDYDPQSGMSLARAYGIDLSEVKPPDPGQAPVAPVRAPTEYGPRETPEIAERAGLIRAAQNVPGDADPALGAAEDQKQIDLAQAERERFAAANETDQEFGGRMDQFAGQQAAFKAASNRAPTYHGQSPIGPVDFDPNAAVASREERLRAQREQLAPLSGAVNDRFRPVVEGMIAAGAPMSEVAKFVAEQQKESHADETKAQYNLTADDQRRHQRENERIGWAQARSKSEDRKTKEDDKLDATVVRDEQGNPIGRVPTGKGGAQGFSTRDADYTRGEEMLQALLDDIKKNGSHVLTPEAALRRQTLHKNAIIGVATVSPLGKTDEAQKLEAASIGSSGAPDSHDMTGVLTGANPEAIQRKLHELQAQRERYRAQTLIPLDENPLMGARRAQKAAPKSNKLTEAREKKSIDDLAREHGL